MSKNDGKEKKGLKYLRQNCMYWKKIWMLRREVKLKEKKQRCLQIHYENLNRENGKNKKKNEKNTKKLKEILK